MLIKTLPVGMLETNCYVVSDEASRKCAIVDPGAESNAILDYIESNDLTTVAVFLTHGHFDHFMALDAVVGATGAPVYINKGDVSPAGQRARHKLDNSGMLNFIAEGDVISVGNLEFSVLETPGHSPGSVTLRCEDALFTGDTLFRGDCGRTDLDGGSEDMLMASLKRLAELDGDFEVYPGHAESSMLSIERSFNPYMKHACKG